MRARTKLSLLAAAATVAALLVWVGRSAHESAATTHASTVLTNTGARIARAGATLQPTADAKRLATGSGVSAFRAFSDDFAFANEDAVQQHMKREGLSRAETLELTFFALLASESHDWDSVEALTSHPIEDEARRQAWVQMQRRSKQMREELQALVKRGAGEAERWDAIDRVESGYLADYYVLTGMSPELLDQLLWLALESQSAAETAAAMAPDAPATRPPGASGNCVKRDPDHPQAVPVPVPCPL